MSRTGRKFIDDVEWVYCCTCDVHTSQLISTFGSHINCNVSEFSRGFPKCIHIAAVAHLSSKVDAIHCLSPAQDFAGIVHKFGSLMRCVPHI